MQVVEVGSCLMSQMLGTQTPFQASSHNSFPPSMWVAIDQEQLKTHQEWRNAFSRGHQCIERAASVAAGVWSMVNNNNNKMMINSIMGFDKAHSTYLLKSCLGKRSRVNHHKLDITKYRFCI